MTGSGQSREEATVIMKKGVEKCLMEWKPVSSRIILARLKGRQTNLSIIQLCAPTSDSDDTNKEAFYEQLQATFESTHCDGRPERQGQLWECKLCESDERDTEHSMITVRG